MAPNADDRRRGPRPGEGGRRGGKAGGQGGERSKGEARDGKRGGQGAGGPRGRKPAPTGENETVQQLTGPLQKVLARLPETQRRVLELRMGLADGHPHDLADTARELGLSLSEAREIEQRAFAHIREAVPLHQLQRFLPKG